MTKKLFAAVALVGCACGVDPKAEAFRTGFPRASTVEVKVPQASTTQGLKGQSVSRDALEGETAQFYGFTRAVTGVVNGAVVNTLDLIERIAGYAPTTMTDDTATWGPYTDPLSPNTWRFTVTRRATNDYTYALEGKAKSAADTDYKTVLSGSHLSTGKNLGSGSFLADWDAAQSLPEHDGSIGTGHFSYARPSAGDAVEVDADFTQVRDGETGQRVDAKYRYQATPGQGGAFEFQMDKDFVAGNAVELLTVKSRWEETGAGRSDVKLSGGDLGSPATANECWDSGFLSRFFVTSFDPALGWGDPAVCAFSTAQYSSL